MFFFNDTATTEIYTLSLHDALPISAIIASNPVPDPMSSTMVSGVMRFVSARWKAELRCSSLSISKCQRGTRSEEHTSELQSRQYLVCRLLLEKKRCSLR